MKKEFTQRELKTIEYFKEISSASPFNYYPWVQPTTIGRMFGGHSAIGSPICKSLVKKGILIRNEKGHYRLK